MKNTILILLFLNLCNGLTAQERPFTENQWFESGQKYLKKKKNEIAISQFYMANKFGKDSNVKILARQKIDSLLPLIQNKIIKQWKGNWKIKELHYNPSPGKFSDYIRFEEDKIVFYHKNLDGKEIITRSELIRFIPYDSVKSFFNVREIKFRNSEIWSFSVKKKNGLKKLYPTLKRDSLGTSSMLLDERGIIIDKKLREKEMKKEIYTFYVTER